MSLLSSSRLANLRHSVVSAVRLNGSVSSRVSVRRMTVVTPSSTAVKHSSQLAHDAYDIAIVGGGMVGTTLAALLASSPMTRHLRVAVLDPSVPKQLPAFGDNSPPGIRVSAFNPSSVQLFQQVNAWQRMKNRHATPFKEMQVWDTFSRGRLHWKADESNQTELNAQQNLFDTYMLGGLVNKVSTENASPKLSGVSPSQSQPSSDPQQSAAIGAQQPIHPTEGLGYIIENENVVSSLSECLHAIRERDGASSSVELVAPIKVNSIQNPLLYRSKRPPPGPDSPFASEDSFKNDPSPGESPELGVVRPSVPIGGATLVQTMSDWPVLSLSNGQNIRARLVVGADGASSMVRKESQMGSWGWDYQQRGVVITVRTEKAHATAWQRFLPWGPIALLPCHDDYSSIVWTTSAQHADHLRRQDSHSLIKDINDAFRLTNDAFRNGGRPSIFSSLLPSSLSEVLPVLFPPPSEAVPPAVTAVMEAPQSFPLRLIHASDYYEHRVALVGDAAHVVHPLAGQGVNLGLSDARVLAQLIADAVYTGQDLGSAHVLRRYDRNRKVANLSIMAGMDGIHKMFSVNDGPFAFLRNVGMDLFNSIPAVKYGVSSVAQGNQKFAQ